MSFVGGKSRLEELRDEATAEAGAAGALVTKAETERRGLTDAEGAAYDAHMAKARRLLEQIKTRKADEGIEARARTLLDGGPAQRRRSTSTWAKDAGERLSSALIHQLDGRKSLVTGTVGVAAPIATDPLELPASPMSILDLVPAKPLGGGFEAGNTFSFLRQTTRSNNAGPVADGEVKPTSVYTLEEIEERVRVIAHLSEPVPERYFADHGNLIRFLQSEMEAGIRSALQTQIISGDGSGENLTGILATPGIESVAFASDALSTIRRALTVLQSSGVTPNALVMHPVDLEALDLLRDGGSTGRFLLGDPGTGSAETIWRIPRVPSTEIQQGTAILADWDQSQLVVREDATVALDRSGDNFTKNLVTMRVEGRFGFAVLRPGSFASINVAGGKAI